MSLNEILSGQPRSAYPTSVKPVVDINLSACTEEDKPRMVALVNRLAKSPCGLETLEIAKAGDFTFSFFEEGVKCCGACDEKGNWIKLNREMTDEKLTGTLCHEARHAGQFIRGAHEAFGVQDIRSELILFRSMEADAQTYAITACHELAMSGDKGPYEAFKERYIEIEGAFSRAMQKNEGVINHDVMTATFKGWYDQNRTKTVYEESYQVGPMQAELSNLMVGKEPALLYTNHVSGEDAVKMAGWTKNGNYFTDSPAILESGKYVQIADSSMTAIQNFFKAREALTGMPADKSVNSLPIRINPIKPKEGQTYTSAKSIDAIEANAAASVKKVSAAVLGKLAGQRKAR